jgi:signal transduction histidine kinase
VWQVSDDGLRATAVWPVQGSTPATFEQATRTAVFARGTGLPGRIWQEAEPLWIADVTRDPNFPRAAIAAAAGLRGAFGFPIRLGDQVLGVIEFFSREIRQPDAELLDMFAGIGAQLGQFIERRRAEDGVRLLNADLERRVAHRTSELADANARLAAALAREQELGRLKSTFVSLVSHEFRTPLGIILSSSEILDRYLESLDPSERRDQIDAITDAVRRMSGLMEQVLMFGRIEAGQLSFKPESLDLAALSRRVCDEVRSATSQRCPIALEQGVAIDGAQGDERLLRHVLTNLLTNAIKYSPPGATVRVSIQREGRDAVFEVADRGIGIPAAQMDKLFTAFHRARNVADIPGTGLGLVIVKNCLDAHGGTIHVESAEGAGTTVRVTVPLYGILTP